MKVLPFLVTIGFLICSDSCIPAVPSPDPTQPDADCTLEAKKCPPCDCTPEAGPVLVDAAPIADAQPAPLPTVDAAPVSNTPCGLACAQLAALGCPEATPNCEATCNHVVTSKLTPYSPTCVSAAKTVAAVQKCPAITCKK